MFKKLKNRFILTNMTMISAVLLLSFAAIYLITAYQMHNQNQLKLENIHSTTLRYQEYDPKGALFQMVVTPEEYTDAFGVVVDEQNQWVFDSSFGTLSREWIGQAIEQTDGREDGKVVLEGRQFLFSRIPAYAKVDSTSEDADIEQFSQIVFFGHYGVKAKFTGTIGCHCRYRYPHTAGDAGDQCPVCQTGSSSH